MLAAAALLLTITYSRDLAPVVYRHCAPCHHANGSGPFPLITYGDVRRHASQVAAVTARRYMPPWPPAHGYGTFADDRSLSASEIALFAAWLHDGAQQGNPHDLPPVPRFTSGWQLGTPDLVLRMPQPYSMPAAGSDVFRNFIISSGLTETRFVRGLEVHLSNERVVHHANVVLDRTASLRTRDGRDGAPGFPGMDVITEAAADRFDPDSHFLFWKRAAPLHLEPAERSWRLDPQTDLVLNLHLQPTGREEPVQAEIGLYFSPQAPTRFPMLLQLEHDGALRIPPGDTNFSITDSLTLPVDVDVLAIYPHAHYLGKTIEAWAALPDGTRRPLIRIADWDINWQAEYEYAQPLFLPRGTRVSMRITYDNSAANPRNPHRPPQLIINGDRSQDEMGHVWLQVLPRTQHGEEQRFALEEAVMRRRLEKYPADFVAHYNLAALEQTRGRLPEALAAYRAALAVEPGSASARNGLATALMLDDQLPAAISELRHVLDRDEGYLNARYNLARALAASGDLAAAASEYGIFLRARPSDAQALAALGTIEYKQHDLHAALASFRAASAAAPADADIQANYGTLLAITGDRDGARDAFTRALAIDPNHAAARANLNRLQHP